MYLEYRGFGLARNRIDESKKRGATRIWLNAFKDGEHMYKKMGFTYES